MEPFEFTSNGWGRIALSRRVKRRKATFYEVIKSDLIYWIKISLTYAGSTLIPGPMVVEIAILLR